jgi:glucosyl-3-phosphoglycerate phosphatase
VTTIILWRHGNTDWNSDGRIQGQLDVPLNSRGVAEATSAAGRLALLKPDLVITSDSGRAVQTAAALTDVLYLPVEQDARLRERSFGPWQGLTIDEVRERFPEAYERWRTGKLLPDDGLESTDDLGKRVAEVILEAADRAPGGRAILITHGGSVKWGLITLLGWPHEMHRTIRGMDNCHWTELWRDPSRGWELRRYNAGV